MSGTWGTPTERLGRRLVEQPDGCRVWTGAVNKRGYGRITVNGKQVKTHRLAWTLTNGPIPDGLNVLHHCDNPPCCEANGDDHLFLGTQQENIADRDSKGRTFNGNADKTHCPERHLYDDVNTYVNPKGQRECRECRKATNVRYRNRLKIHRLEMAAR